MQYIILFHHLAAPWGAFLWWLLEIKTRCILPPIRLGCLVSVPDSLKVSELNYATGLQRLTLKLLDWKVAIYILNGVASPLQRLNFDNELGRSGDPAKAPILSRIYGMDTSFSPCENSRWLMYNNQNFKGRCLQFMRKINNLNLLAILQAIKLATWESSVFSLFGSKFSEVTHQTFPVSVHKHICLLSCLIMVKNKSIGLLGLEIYDAQLSDLLKLVMSSRNLKSLGVFGYCRGDEHIPDLFHDENLVLKSKTTSHCLCQ